MGTKTQMLVQPVFWTMPGLAVSAFVDLFTPFLALIRDALRDLRISYSLGKQTHFRCGCLYV